MLPNPDLMRLLLFSCSLGMALLAGFYLRGRNLIFWAYLGLGLLILFLPLIGPFLVIWIQPGSKRE